VYTLWEGNLDLVNQMGGGQEEERKKERRRGKRGFGKKGVTPCWKCIREKGPGFQVLGEVARTRGTNKVKGGNEWGRI